MKLSISSPPPSPRKGPAPGRKAFSLLELLVVVAVMSTLAAFTMPSVSSLWSVSLTSSGNQTAEVFAMARQNSIAKDTYTAVVIKSQGADAFRAYCLLELTRQDDGSFGAWEAVSPWRYLGQGVAFESGQADDTFVSSSASLPKPLPANFPFQGQGIDLTASTICQCYQPEGTLTTQPMPPVRMVLRLIEGRIDSLSGTLSYLGATSSGKPVSYYDLVFVGNTGIAKIERP